MGIGPLHELALSHELLLLSDVHILCSLQVVPHGGNYLMEPGRYGGHLRKHECELVDHFSVAAGQSHKAQRCQPESENRRWLSHARCVIQICQLGNKRLNVGFSSGRCLVHYRLGLCPDWD